ncbi:MAG: hypothetical protein QXS16_03705 [Pyrobaculum sp.]
MHGENNKILSVVARLAKIADAVTLALLGNDARLVEIGSQLQNSNSVKIVPLLAFDKIYGYELTANPLFPLSSSFFDIVQIDDKTVALFDKSLSSNSNDDEGYDVEKIALLEELEKQTLDSLLSLASLSIETNDKRIVLSNILINNTKSEPGEFFLYDSAHDVYYNNFLKALSTLHLLPYNDYYFKVETLDEFFPVWRGFVEGVEDDKIVRI